MGDSKVQMKTVLVIEDEAQTRNIFLKCLEFEGFRAQGAINGTEGIHQAKRCQPDLIVCDVMMPDIDGYTVLKTLRNCPATAAIPLIFLTAKVTMTDLRRGMEMGADDYLTKPCTVEQFLAAIATRLKRHEELLSLGQRSPEPPSAEASDVEDSPPLDPIEAENIFPHCPKLAAVFHFIEAHYREAINLQDVAQEAGYSAAYLTSLVQEQTGHSIKRWIIERRMAQARALLRSTAASVRHIAELSGYSDPGYFTRQFRQLHGVSPQIWRQNL
ncbi:MAG TPA: response regulator [Candidatus Obscuribacterales bacterium]